MMQTAYQLEIRPSVQIRIDVNRTPDVRCPPIAVPIAMYGHMERNPEVAFIKKRDRNFSVPVPSVIQ